MRLRKVLTVAAVALSIAACSEADDGEADRTDVSETSEQESSAMNTETTFDDGIPRVAGVSLTTFGDYEINPALNFTMVPPNWPTLSGVTLWHAANPIEEPQVGAGVLAQAELGLERAGEIIEAGFRYPGLEGAEVLSSGRVEGLGRVCSYEYREGEIGGDGSVTRDAMIVVGGDGMASFGMYLSGQAAYPLDVLLGDVVEEVCGARPSGDG